MKKIKLRIANHLNTLFLLAAIFSFSDLRAEAADDQKQKLFEKVFGAFAQIDSQMREKILASGPGKRFYTDPGKTGRPTEVWFIDDHFRHLEKDRPVLVHAIDRNGDLYITGEPDMVADLYIADWGADGSVDAALEYIDTDNDGHVDEMAMYFVNSVWQKGNDKMMVWWSRDVGGDQLLWYNVSYTYHQFECEDRCHFNGNEMFASFKLELNDDHWTPWFENPFLFYDRDFDGIAEEAIRLEGYNNEIHNVRWSFDANNNANPSAAHNYDVSVSGHTLPGSKFGKDYGEPVMIHGIPTTPLMKYDAAHHFLNSLKWKDIILTWDENDNNVNNMRGNYRDGRYVEDFERWEGVIASKNPKFEGIGGPDCGEYNKRYELISKQGHQIKLYYAPADQRLHLLHADSAWINVDFNMDFKTDMHYWMIDTDHDGAIDRWDIDLNGDQVIDDSFESGEPVDTVDWQWALINAKMERILTNTPSQLFRLNNQLEAAIQKLDPETPRDEVAKVILSGFHVSTIEPYSKKLRESDESLRYYFDILKDRLIWKLKQICHKPGFWNDFNKLRGMGDLNGMCSLLQNEFGLPRKAQTYTRWHEAYRKQFSEPATAYAVDWIEPNIGWESEQAAYRAYWGQFDFFGKKKPGLIYPSFSTPDAEDYHHMTSWGIDALHVKKTGGCGGVTLFVNDKAYPVRDPNGEKGITFEKRLVFQNNDTVMIEFTAKGIGPENDPYNVRFRCSALAGRADSPIEILVTGGNEQDHIGLGIGLEKLPGESLLVDTDAGVFGSWGKQTDIIGFIGMGVIYPKQRYSGMQTTSDENLLVLKLERDKPLVYHLQCDWLDGRQYNRCFNAAMWLDELRETAAKTKLHLK